MQKPIDAPNKGARILVYDWMIRAYNLKGTTLLIYAIIHSFSRDGKGVFNGSLRYLSFWTGKTKPTVLKVLKNLAAQNLIQKKEIRYTRLNQNRHYCEYWTVFSRLSEEEQEWLAQRQ